MLNIEERKIDAKKKIALGSKIFICSTIMFVITIILCLFDTSYLSFCVPTLGGMIGGLCITRHASLLVNEIKQEENEAK